MPNDFVIAYKPTATANQITAVQHELESIGPGPVDQDGGNDSFDARLNWGTQAKDLNNLKGKLNAAANANVVTAVTVA